MAYFKRASPALKEILLKIYRAEKPMEVEHELHEFGSLQYHIQSSSLDKSHTYLSISTPFLSQRSIVSHELPISTMNTIKGICPEVVEIVEPAREGYQLTMKLCFARIPRKRDAVKVIEKISTVHALIMSSLLRDMLRSINSPVVSPGTHNPVKIVYHPREPFFVIKQIAKITTVFPMRFKEHSDVIIATAFFQELMDVAESCAKAPHCNWSPIPPPELKGESIDDLSTNGGFVSFEISPRHVKGKRLDKTIWNLLNFNALVKNHVKSTKGFVQRRMRNRMESLVKDLKKIAIQEDHRVEKAHNNNNSTLQELQDKAHGCLCMGNSVRIPRCKVRRLRCNLAKKIKRIRSKIKIHGFNKFHRRWLSIPKFSSVTSYKKLE